MLVLSRKENQRVLFPNLGIACQIVKVAGNTVRVGIVAPADVRVLREEIADPQDFEAADQARERRHALRNRLNTAMLALHVAQKQLNCGLSDEAEESLAQVLDDFSQLDELISDELPRASAVGTPKHRRRILVVEDNAHERELLAGYLELCGFEVSTVEDGVEAMRWLSNHARPDVVLLDMHMPRMNGRKTISAIRRDPSLRELKVFAVSGDTAAARGMPSGEGGVDHWFSKPLSPTRFAEELESRLPQACAIA